MLKRQEHRARPERIDSRILLSDGRVMQEEIFELPEDYEGRVIATLLFSEATATSAHYDGKGVQTPANDMAARPSDSTESTSPVGAVLYVHGYIDYFFQTHMAEMFNAAGYDFYALDLRKYGRSLLPHQTPYYCRDLHEYYPEIDRSIERIVSRGSRRIVLMGHSTGGLLTSLYMNDGAYRESISRLVLNSPFLEFNAGWFKRCVAIPVVSVLSRLFPYAHKRNELSPHYTASVHDSMRGEWSFDLRLKPLDGVPLYFAWLRAIRCGHRRVKRGLHIGVPILVMHSTQSTTAQQWDESYTRSDGVLNVQDIRRYGQRLGDDVSDISVTGGLHDLILSQVEIRTKVFATILAWLRDPDPRAESRTI